MGKISYDDKMRMQTLRETNGHQTQQTSTPLTTMCGV